ncbi:hypothetical protein SAMN02745163_00504 [Clostridium cavendishii DSM 21758]|uniref:Uncharacterized protein n=2 Tax=Clostridium TaxID=1485 RepID=A0A1M6CML5_9CLOT|nr:hypothetical protein SAMN02745163_00504 [Clostridium cavendishii DSM 21758]
MLGACMRKKFLSIAIGLLSIFTLILLFNYLKENEMIVKKLKNEIRVSKLDDKQRQLLNVFSGGNIYSYDINCDRKAYKKLDIWLERYEKGEFKGEAFRGSEESSQINNSNIKYMFSFEDTERGKIYRDAMVDGEKMYWVGKSDMPFDKLKDIMVKYSFGTDNKKIDFNKDIILAVWGERKESYMEASLSDATNVNEEKFKKIINDERAFILKCKFSK